MKDYAMKIGDTVTFEAVFEDGTKAQATGTVADIRDDTAFAFVLGYRWPFTIALGGRRYVGFYPRSMSE